MTLPTLPPPPSPGTVFSRVPGFSFGPLLYGALAITTGVGLAVAVGSNHNPWVVPLLLVGAGVAVITMRRADFGASVLVFIAYTRFSDNLIRYVNAPSIAEPFIGLMVIVIGLRWMLYGERPTGWETGALLLGIYGLAGAIGVFFASAPSLVLKSLTIYSRDIIIALIVVSQLKRLAQLRFTIWTLLAAGLMMGSITIYQQVTGTFTNPYWGFGVATIQNIVGQTNDYRIGGVVGDPNFYAQILVFLVPLAMDRFWNETRWYLRGLAAMALTIIVLSILFTFSRGGFLSLIFVVGLSLVRHPPRVTTWLTLGLVVVLSIQVLPPKYTDRILTLSELLPSDTGQVITDPALLGRTSVILAAWRIFLDHPLLGVGLGNHPLYIPDYSVQVGLRPTNEQRPVHDIVLEILADTGVVGLVTLVVVLGIVLRNARQAQAKLSRAGRLADAGQVAAIGIATAGYLLGAAFLPNAYPRYLWVIVGLALSLPNLVANELTAGAPSETHP